jgi:hypothetical protein
VGTARRAWAAADVEQSERRPFPAQYLEVEERPSALPSNHRVGAHAVDELVGQFAAATRSTIYRAVQRTLGQSAGET